MAGTGLNALDIAVIAVLLVSALLAFGRGFVREVLSIGAWIAAGVATIYGFPYLQPVLRQHIGVALIADAVTGAVIFIVTLILFTAIASLLTRNLRTSAFGALDRSLGFLFGLARGAVLVCLAYLVATWLMTPQERPDWLKEARSLPYIATGAEVLAQLLPQTAEDGQAAAEETREQVEQAIDAGEAMQQLGGSGAPAGDAPPANPAGPGGDSGYKNNERNDLDRLIQGSQ
jgi:membrane protein required for colicin V production